MLKKLKSIETVLDSFFKFGIAALFIFIPLYPKFPLFDVPFTYVSIRVEDFLIAALWLLFFLKLIAKPKIIFPKISFQIFIFFFVGLVSCLSAIFITNNVRPLLTLLHYFRRIEYISAFFLVYFASQTYQNRKFFLELVFVPAIGVFLYGIAQLYFGAPVISTMDSESSKGIALTLRPGVMLSSTFAGHYDLAVYLCMIMIFMVALTCFVTKRLHQVILLSSFTALMWLFMQTSSRISLAGLVLGISLVIYLYRKWLLGVIFFGIIGIGLFTSPQLLARLQSILNVLKQTTIQIVPSVYALTSPESVSTISATPIPIPTEIPRAIQADRSTSIRFDVEWPRAIRALSKNILLGTGYSSLTLATDNDYLRSLGETGILGFLSLISIFVGITIGLRNNFKKVQGCDKVITVSLLGVLVFFAVTGLFLDVLEASKIAILFWSYLGLAASIKS